MTDEVEHDTGQVDDSAARWYYSEIMKNLLQSERFCNWFQVNFEVHKLINDEEKSIEIRVLELPPELVQERMQEQLMVKMQAEAEEANSSIVVASPADLKALEKAAKKKRAAKKRGRK